MNLFAWQAYGEYSRPTWCHPDGAGGNASNPRGVGCNRNASVDGQYYCRKEF